MSMGPILVTGADGFVGRHLVPRLRARFADRQVAATSFDICDRAAVGAALRHARPSCCVHLAAISTVAGARADPDGVWRVNLHGTLNLARAVLDEAPTCQLVFAASADAYGRSFASGCKLDETAALAPLNAYGATKAAADLALGAMATEGLRVVRLRPFNHTGPGQSEAFVVPAFARQVARIAAGLQPAVIEVGDLAPLRDFLDVRDVCDAYLACVAHGDRLAPGTVLNLASGVARRVGDVLDDLLALGGVTAEIRPDPGRMRRSDIPTATGDAGRASELLSWSAVIPWEQTLRDVLDDWHGRVSGQGLVS